MVCMQVLSEENAWEAWKAAHYLGLSEETIDLFKPQRRTEPRPQNETRDLG